jgi:hypothetical protein
MLHDLLILLRLCRTPGTHSMWLLAATRRCAQWLLGCLTGSKLSCGSHEWPPAEHCLGTEPRESVASGVAQVGAQYKTAEVAKSEWQMVQQSPPWAVDAWGLGCLMQEAFSGRTLTRTEELRNTEAIPQAVLQARTPATRTANLPRANERTWRSWLLLYSDPKALCNRRTAFQNFPVLRPYGCGRSSSVVHEDTVRLPALKSLRSIIIGSRHIMELNGCAWQDYQRLLGSQPTRRLNPSKIAESSVIKNKLVDTIAFLENLSVKV